MRAVTRLAVLFLVAAVALVATAPAPAEDVVILNDGFAIRGKVTRERPPLSGDFSVRINLDAVLDGPKIVFFSTHSKKQLAAIEKGLPTPPPVAYRRGPFGTMARKLPPVGELQAPDWKDDWSRTIKIKLSGGGYELIDQRITYLGPDSMYVYSTSHAWGQAYDTREYTPAQIRKMLITHPDLKDPPEGADPMRRMKIAAFMRDTGWTVAARDELAKLKKDAKGPWKKEETERFDQLTAEIDTAESKLVIEELEAAVASGRYRMATSQLARYEPKSSDAKDLTRLAELRATIEKVYPQYEATKRLLRNLIDSTTGDAAGNARGAAAGGFTSLATARPKLLGDTATLVTAANAILSELHPDTASRLEMFRMAAENDERMVAKGSEPTNKPEILYALAINGWLRGKNGAIPDVPSAVKTWNTRQMAVTYLRERIGNERAGVLKAYLASTNKLPPADMAQIIGLLPPVDAEPLDKMNGRLIKPAQAHGVEGMYSRNTGPVPEDAAGLDYLLKLPDEYHHGRAYPLVIALTDPAMDTEKTVAGLTEMANKHGYIIAAPKWTVGYTPPFDYTGKNHPQITGVMRDVSRRFQVDPDKVFLFGIGQGATLALDVGLGHPDLFAGLTLFGPTPVFQFYQYIWTNAQKLPIFTVTGDMSGASWDTMRKLNESWLPNGYPSLVTVYRGRGAEWHAPEVPTAFDWMNRKTRARGVASLRLTDKRFDAWKTMRSGDNRFYWVGVESMHSRHEFSTPDRPDKAPLPATVRADIRRGNEIFIDEVRGVKKLAVWLEKDMIDWTKPVKFTMQAARTLPKAKVMEPDLKLMFEELYRTGDKKMLFFGKVEIDTTE